MTVTSSPHIQGRDSTRGIMADVIIALIPALLAGIWLFGPRAALVTGVSVLTCVLAEWMTRKLLKRPNTLKDCSAVVTGLLLAFNMPPAIPLWMVAIGAVVAIVIVKQFFGGIGQNFVNPALLGRIVLMVSFPSQMTTWSVPFAWMRTDAVTSASPLAVLKSTVLDGSGKMTDRIGKAGLPTLQEMFFGMREGCLGEVCIAALLLGGAYLIARRVISPVVPLSFLGTVALGVLWRGQGNGLFLAYEMMAGGLCLGAIFMATDYATCPLTPKGRLLYGVGCGLITLLIRLAGNLPEGVSFAIILMNILTPHIDRTLRPTPFGMRGGRKKAAKGGEVA